MARTRYDATAPSLDEACRRMHETVDQLQLEPHTEGTAAKAIIWYCDKLKDLQNRNLLHTSGAFGACEALMAFWVVAAELVVMDSIKNQGLDTMSAENLRKMIAVTRDAMTMTEDKYEDVLRQHRDLLIEHRKLRDEHLELLRETVKLRGIEAKNKRVIN